MTKIVHEKLENIAIIGNGGRENSLAWAIQKNKLIKNIFLIPGNGGSGKIRKCQNLNLDYENKNLLIQTFNSLKIDLIIIGPEIPLANGLGDFLRSKNFQVFGPNSNGAKLESSKSWAKSFMKEANIPTAKFWKASSVSESEKIISNAPFPLVVKADGLASGKGVFIPETKEDTIKIAKEIINGKFGESGKIVLLEEKIEGPEISIFALCDGKKYILLPSAQDHKRIEENDRGLNTGGMGAYAPTPILSKSELSIICKEIIEPTIDELIKRKIEYKGVLYFGLMITKSGPKVIEYNCRFGDPECQTIMPLMDTNFVNILYKCASGNLNGDEELLSSSKVSACVIASSKGYPENYNVGYPITFNNDESEDIQVFHSGTSINKEGIVLSNGGRVLSVVCQGNDFDSAFNLVYKVLGDINFEGIYFRRDIGHQVRKNFSDGDH